MGNDVQDAACTAALKSELTEVLAGRFRVEDALTLTSSPRSGSTWLAETLTTIPRSCFLLEPLHLEWVPEARAAGFAWRTWVPTDAKWPAGEHFLRRVFEGRVVNDRTLERLNPDEARTASRLIVKFVRAGRLLPWLCRTIPLPPPVLLIRHPCAVVASQLKSDNWKALQTVASPGFLSEFPAFQEALADLNTVEERLAAQWALDQLPPLLEEQPHPWQTVTYEELNTHTAEVLERISRTWGIEIDIHQAVANSRRPSRSVWPTGISGMTGWANQLSSGQIERILSTVRRFGLEFYGKGLEPDLALLHSTQLSAMIRAAGAAA